MGKASRRRRDRRQEREIKLSPKSVDILEEQRRRFIAKFGRPPGAGDPVFFDPESEVPTPISEKSMTAAATELLRRAGADPATIYAYQETGMFPPTPGDRHSRADRREWDEAIARYHELHGDDPDNLDQAMNERLADVVFGEPEQLREFMIGAAGLLSRPRGYAGVEELLARISDLDGEDGTMLAQMVAVMFGWFLSVREGYAVEDRERVVQAASVFSAALSQDAQQTVADLQSLLLPVNAELTVAELFERHDSRDIMMGAWTLVHGIIVVLGGGDAEFLERLKFVGEPR